MPSFANSDEEALATIIKHPLCLIGASDGGAHTKFLTTGRYPTHFLAHWVRDKQLMALEEAHWRLSTMLGWAIGIRDRGWLREGMPADIVIYDLQKLRVLPMETLYDLPDNDWRRVQKADGYHFTIVNGVIPSRAAMCRDVAGQNAAQLRDGGIKRSGFFCGLHVRKDLTACSSQLERYSWQLVRQRFISHGQQAARITKIQIERITHGEL
jgi:N-acyl-D-aspartate/D-glutamate deacylase